jgi:hypothetical protein
MDDRVLALYSPDGTAQQLESTVFGARQNESRNSRSFFF